MALPLDEQAALFEQGLLELELSPAVVAAVMSVRGDGFVLLPSETTTRSRFGGGGQVRLPTGEPWPETFGVPLTFLFEIAMEDLVGIDGFPDAPRDGSLLVFHDESGTIDTSYRSSTRVLFRADADAGEETMEGAEYEDQLLSEVPLEGFAIPNLPRGPELRAALEPLFGDQVELTLAWGDVAMAIEELMPYVSPAQVLFGAPDVFRVRSLYEIIADWFCTAEAAADRAFFTEAELRGEGWRPFLQPDDSGSPVDWSTGGYRYHVIPAADLTTGRFDRVITVFDGANSQ